MVKQFRKAVKKAAGNKRGSKTPSSQTKNNISKSQPIDKVTRITEDGFWLRVDGKRYFLAFLNFPWFRYAPVWAITRINKLIYNSTSEPDDVAIIWKDLGHLKLTIGQIKHISKHPVKLTERISPIENQSTLGKFTNRIPDPRFGERYFEVGVSVKAQGKFIVTACSEEQAREYIETAVYLRLGGVGVWVNAPFNDLYWRFDLPGKPQIESVKDAEPDSMPCDDGMWESGVGKKLK